MSYARGGTSIPLSGLVYLVTFIYLSTLVVDAPLRFWLNAGGAFPLIYLPKALLIFCLPLLLIARMRMSRVAPLMAGVVGLWFIWGGLYLGNWEQPLFCLWILVPVFYGLLAAPYVAENLNRYRALVLILFLISVGGVLLNIAVHYPWSGESIKFAGVETEVARQWTTLGLPRLAGFSRASYDAATQVLVFAVWLLATTRGRFSSLLIFLVAGIAITVTTSKVVLGAYLVLLCYYGTGALLRWSRGWRGTWAVAVWVVAVAGVALPLSTLAVSYTPSLHSFTSRLVLRSFWTRLAVTWPGAFQLLQQGWNWIIGIGLGGIGTPQKYFALSHNPADNMFVYLVVDLGVIAGLWLMLLLAYKVSRGILRGGRRDLAGPLGLFIFLFGVTGNVVEQPLIGLILGLVAAWPAVGRALAENKDVIGAWTPNAVSNDRRRPAAPQGFRMDA